ncbi:MAG TPA: YidC/Oxa1 family membrane protein insertase [Candidatus Atribacteria bacterium]|nr:YidC/Oxa1 family membrane protein insertase [Candidatus Atribacteria bacterium]
MFSQLLDILAQAMEYLLRFFYNWTGDYGISIILLTLLIRLILSPLIHKQTLSTRKMQEDMQELQPEIKKLQEKYGNNSQKLNEEMMKLYKEKGINPLGGCLPGCLPLLIQLPILVVLYRVLMAYDYGQAGFLWLPSLSQKDPYFILPLLMGITTFWQQKISMPPTTDKAQAQQSMVMMVVMPVFLVFISWNLPAGVLLYWFVSNLFYILQQYVLNNQIQKAKALSLKPEINAEVEPAISLESPSLTGSTVKKGGKTSAKKR